MSIKILHSKDLYNLSANVNDIRQQVIGKEKEYLERLQSQDDGFGYCAIFNGIICTGYSCSSECYKITKKDKFLIKFLGGDVRDNNFNLE